MQNDIDRGDCLRGLRREGGGGKEKPSLQTESTKQGE